MKLIYRLLILFLSTTSLYGQNVNMQNGTVTQCTGIFYDSGGEFGNYDDNENFVFTLCPQDAGDKMQLDFRVFSTQFNVDFLTIYDGDDTTAPSLGTFSGGAGPGLVQASDINTSGCLTIEFISNGMGNGPGWEADIACARPCQTIVANLDSTVPALQPGNIVVADVDEVITFNGSGTFSVDGAGATYLWDFGDGNTAVGQSVTHSYNPAGLYNVTLTITDDNPAGCESTNDIGLTAQIGGSTPGNPFVDAGPDITIDCADTCTTLSADFLDIGETNTYTISQIPFVPPFPFQGLANSVNTNIDDAWDDPQPLPIDFCFFGNIEPEFQVGSNGLIRFDVNPADVGSGSNAFNLQNNPLPNNTNPALGEGNVFTPVHDIDPAASSGEEIAWEIIGTAPNRVLAVSFYNVQMWQCSSAIATHMAVFYETTNVIDIYIQNAPFCDRWNNNKAVGIQNNAGTVAFVPPGRNTNDNGGWTTSDEAWRFTPAGPSIIDFAWLDETGAVVGTTPTLDVCPINDVATYTARVTYTSCNGDTVVVTDDVIVSRDVPFTVDLGNDIEACEGDSDIVLDADIGSATATYQWFLNGTPIAGEINATLTVASPNSGNYSVEVSDQSCSLIEDVIVTFSEVPTINAITQYQLCDDATIDGFTEFDLSTKLSEILGGQTDVNVSFHENANDANDDLNPLPNLFTNTVNPQTIFVRLENVNNENCYDVTTLELLVSSGFTLDDPDDLVLCDDFSEDGIEDFDFTQQTIDILAPYTNVTLSYHLNLDDAENDVAALPNVYQNITNPQTIFVRLEDDTNPLCFAITNFDIEVLGLPVVTSVTPLISCDDDTDGFVAFQLSLKTNEILAGQTNVEVSYHETFNGAENNTDEIFDGYINTTANNQTIFIRLEDTITGCYNTTTLDLEVLANPLANTPTAFEVCDDDSDGITSFALGTKTPEVLGGQTDMVVTYHATPADALSGTAALPDPYTNTVAGGETIYVRIESTLTGCFATTTLQLVVNPSPTTVVTDDIRTCDDNNPGDFQEVFDLSAKDTELVNGQANVTVAYYPSQADADALTNAITTPYTNTSTPQTIVAVLTNTLTGCSSQIPFDIVVDALPTVVAPTPLEVCDDGVADGITEMDLSLKDTEITGGNPDYSVSYHETPGDADLGQDALPVPYTNTVNNQVVYVRVEDTVTGCYDTTALELIVQQAPVAFAPQPLLYCDPDSDGFGVFDLTAADAEITGGDAALEVSYHETQANAENGVDAIVPATSYANITEGVQTLYARVENPNIATDCAVVVELELIVEPTPQIADPLPLEACDDATPDGLLAFDLTVVAADVLNGLDPVRYVLSYYATEADADAAASAIANPFSYVNTVPGGQTVWIRVEDTATAGGCYKLTSLELVVNPLPVAQQPLPLELCDDLGEVPGDELTVFDLTVKDPEITGGNGSWSVAYYETLAGAQSQTGAIGDPTAYTNTSVGGLPANPQTLYAVVTDTGTGCTDRVTLTIRVLPNPTPTPSDQLPDLELCDEVNTGDGVEQFDLTQNELLLLNGETGVTVTYHETAGDAGSGTNAILDPTAYTNAALPDQTIYVRVTSDATGCYALVDFDIRVDPLPEVVAVTDFVQCELNTDGFAGFDLTSKDAEVLGGQDPTAYTVSYHATLADAESLANALLSPYTNTANPQEIYVAITDNATGCSIATQRFDLEVQEAARANPDTVPITYGLCDDEMELDGDPTDDSVQFDLGALDAEVLDGQDPTGYTVSYYATEQDALLGVSPLPGLYENVANPQVIYARVDNDIPDGTGQDSSICFDVAPLTLRVDPLPGFVLEESYTLCVGADGSEAIGPPSVDTGLSAAGYTFEWTYGGNVLAGETGPSLAPLQGGSYGVTVTDVVTGCTSAGVTVVVESGPPTIVVELVSEAFSGSNVVRAEATGTGVYEYSLDGGPWQESGTFVGVSPGLHVVTARDVLGCGQASGEVVVLDYPRFFTPNGDGNNDTWNIAGIDGGHGKNLYI
jgi:hypothetical protein